MGEAGDRENKAQVAAQRNLRRAVNHILACFRPWSSNCVVFFFSSRRRHTRYWMQRKGTKWTGAWVGIWTAANVQRSTGRVQSLPTQRRVRGSIALLLHFLTNRVYFLAQPYLCLGSRSDWSLRQLSYF